MLAPKSRNSNIYSAFAEIYDHVMREIDYQAWAAHVHRLWLEHGFNPKTVLNLACGTGKLEPWLTRLGCEATGLDCSPVMLSKARENCANCRPKVEFVESPMQRFALPDRYDLVLCLYDSVNYLTRVEDVRKMFRCVARHLKPGGGLIFDVATEYHMITSYSGDCPYAEAWPRGAYVWDNEYRLSDRTCHSHFTIFLPARRGSAQMYQRHDEHHWQRVYAGWELEQMLVAAGLEFVGAYHGMTLNPPQEDSERIHFVARKPE